MDQAGDRAIDLGNGKFRPALVDITPANIRLDIALRRCLGDVRQPGAFECFLQDPLQSRDIACLRRAHDGSILCHFPSPANACRPKVHSGFGTTTCIKVKAAASPFRRCGTLIARRPPKIHAILGSLSRNALTSRW
ncbi:hypothetical protein [Mesorhizobium sp. Root102]|uniref:hypothetical protein n=1 Tax=Mesorhizobium sp. Root102 TaxID=1736422 RepID=UPI001FCCFE3C|nr:hypothetical protein [Mesorhizobium sp. Root102]